MALQRSVLRSLALVLVLLLVAPASVFADWRTHLAVPDRIMVPVRFVTEGLGRQVMWLAKYRSIIITTAPLN